MKFDLNLDPIKRPDVKHCKGLYFRCRMSQFISSKGEYIYTEKMIPLKRKSCTGCDKCMPVLDCFDDILDIPVVIEKIVDGGLYKLDIINESRDWETGIIDEWDLGFVFVK